MMKISEETTKNSQIQSKLGISRQILDRMKAEIIQNLKSTER